MNKKLDLTLIIYGLALFSGISYLWGFWVNFDVNIISYVALTDIVKASVYPALPAIGVLAIYSAMDGFNSISKEKREEMVNEGGFFKGYTYFVKYYAIAIFLLAISNTVYLIYTEEGYFKLKGFYPLISIVLFYYIIASKKYLSSMSINSKVFLVTIICFLPTYLFNKGFENGVLASDHSAQGFYVVGKMYCNSNKDEKFRYISVIGNKLFSYSSKSNNVCITKAEDFQLVKYNLEKPQDKATAKSVANKSLKQDK